MKDLIIPLVILFASIGICIIMVVIELKKTKKAQEIQKNFASTLPANYVSHTIGERLSYLSNTNDNKIIVCLANTNRTITHMESPFYVTKYEKIGLLGSSFVAFDDKNNKLLYVNDKNYFSHDNLEVKSIKYDDIISVQILEDGDAIFEKSALRTIGGTLAGGALLGGAGAVVGGLSGRSTQKKTVRSIKIKFILRSTITPSYEIVIYQGEKKAEKLKQYYEKADAIKDTISVILDRLDREASAKIQEQQAARNQTMENKNDSAVEQLSKLANLLEKGLLTEEEFKQQKEKILNS